MKTSSGPHETSLPIVLEITHHIANPLTHRSMMKTIWAERKEIDDDHDEEEKGRYIESYMKAETGGFTGSHRR